MNNRCSRGRRARALLAAGLLAAAVVVPTVRVDAEGYVAISGAGSTWAQNAINTMQVNVDRNKDMKVNYTGSGSSAGRREFINGTVDFAASDIPFQFDPEDGTTAEAAIPGEYAYIPIVAGGTSFIYNLKINGKRVTNLRLSGENVAKIFTGVITMWNDPALAADNPGITLPGRAIVPVVRAEGSGSTAQFTMWMIDRFPDIWTDYCHRVGHTECGFTSLYPTGAVPGMIAQTGDPGVTTYVTGSPGEGSIGYVNYSYAREAGFPVAKVLNAAGYYTEPTPQNVAVSLLRADINDDASNPSVYLTQDLARVYDDPDPRNYQLSAYSYLILRTVEKGSFTADKGKTLAAFAYYAMCEAQQSSADLGYSPIPLNLVQKSFDQIRKVPGADTPSITVDQCNNPTFSPDGGNRLAEEAPQPLLCDKRDVPTQCEKPTGGATEDTPVTGGGSQYNPDNQPTPGQNPQDPSDEPQNPSDEPQNPSDEPQDPSDEPQNPSDEPQNPSDEPQNPSNDPQNPAASSTTTTAPCDPNATTTSSTSTMSSSAAPAESTSSTSTMAPCTTVPGGASTTTAVAVCDPDTGVCGTQVAANLTGNDEAAGAGAVEAREVAGAKPSTIRGDPGWGLAQTSMLIVVVLLTFAVIVLPAFVWRRLSVRSVTP